MRRITILFVGLCACTPTGSTGADQAQLQAQLDALSEEVERANEGIERIEDRLDAIADRLDRASAASPPRPALPSPPPLLGADPPPPIDPAKLEAGIRCDAERCTITSELRDELLANPTRLARAARLVPALREGEAVGYKLYGIRSNTIVAMLGFQNGDLVRAVAGRELTSLEVAMDAYTTLRTATEIELDIERKGEAMRIVIAIE